MALIESGLRYCLTHEGLAGDERPDCVLTPLLYERPALRGAKPNPDGCQARLRGRWGVHAKCWLPAGHEESEHTNGHRAWTESGESDYA